ncbi:hypothetical protein VTJ04DRAFT_43 [Mycothermus thermophilus]|uniref:uncharacterized protein n=1 Tax=Humicola insolens TaxID=85995 RepID=UPI003742E09C
MHIYDWPSTPHNDFRVFFLCFYLGLVRRCMFWELHFSLSVGTFLNLHNWFRCCQADGWVGTGYWRAGEMGKGKNIGGIEGAVGDKWRP